MATYLEGAQKLARECGAGSSPTTVVSQSGESRRFVDWYADAYLDIQNRHPKGWRWLRHSFTVNTTASDDTYAPSDCTDQTTSTAISRFGAWRLEDPYDYPKCYLTSAGVGGEYWLVYTPWEQFKSIYKLGSQSTSQPAHISIDPQNNLVLGPSPNGIYTITGDYYRAPQILAADSDTPEMPSQFHNMIVWAAMEDYGYFELAQEVLARGKERRRRATRHLESDQLEPISLPGALA